MIMEEFLYWKYNLYFQNFTFTQEAQNSGIILHRNSINIPGQYTNIFPCNQRCIKNTDKSILQNKLLLHHIIVLIVACVFSHGNSFSK